MLPVHRRIKFLLFFRDFVISSGIFDLCFKLLYVFLKFSVFRLGKDIFSHLYLVFGIYSVTVFINAEMQVRTRTHAGTAYVSDELPLLYFYAALYALSKAASVRI